MGQTIWAQGNCSFLCFINDHPQVREKDQYAHSWTPGGMLNENRISQNRSA